MWFTLDCRHPIPRGVRGLVQTCLAMRDHENFGHGGLKRRNICIYTDFLLEAVAWSHVAEAVVNVALWLLRKKPIFLSAVLNTLRYNISIVY